MFESISNSEDSSKRPEDWMRISALGMRKVMRHLTELELLLVEGEMIPGSWPYTAANLALI
jgi:hypothetical protein